MMPNSTKAPVDAETRVSSVSLADDAACWRAVETRDARADGRIIVAVKTTGIYCKPSCRSRQPKRINVRFFATAAEARDAGFRACKRCHPDAV
jgi:methylphosphotriester-DNA--protein-cysteine methyltransferase